MRTFIAVELEPELKKRLAAIQRDLKTAGADLRWTHPDGIHLTLKFIGEIGPHDLQQVTAIMAQAVHGISPFEFHVARIGAFPSDRSPRVVWIGVQDPTGSLEKINAALEERLQTLGIRKENKRFRPETGFSLPRLGIRGLTVHKNPT